VESVERGDHSLDEIVTARDDCRTGLDEESSSANIVPGEQMTFRDLLYCSMIQSASDACNVLASLIGGSITGFVDLMNERAEELGCTVTYFEDPNGLSNNNQTTAYEMFLITQEAIRHDYFMAVCNIADVTIPATNVGPEREYHNSNSLISSQSVYGGNRYLYTGAAGVKTGYTRAAGYCLISTAEREGLHFLAVVMGCDGWLNAHIEDYLNFEDSIKLYDWAFSNFVYRNVIDTATPVYELDVQFAQDDAKAVLYPQQNLRVLVPRDTTEEDVQLDFNIFRQDLVAPVRSGEVFGEAVVSVNGEVFGTVNLITRDEVELARSEYMKRQLKDFFSNRWVIGITVMVLLVIALYTALQIRYRKARAQYLEERRQAELRRRKRQKELEEKRREGWDL
ncbi:MAG: D-alanyl-D-alanine carboxypeptidase, partial [Oscillospiraceae bacterium]|nr:D-alanyl-D-alanine carboxypeptidase [Oscillospiraceae bacterium]